jgi:hypothetical protein
MNRTSPLGNDASASSVFGKDNQEKTRGVAEATLQKRRDIKKAPIEGAFF